MDRSFEELEAIVRNRICSVCTERTTEGQCGLENPSSCALFQLFPQVAQAIQSVHSNDIHEYIEAIRRNVCSVCKERAQDRPGVRVVGYLDDPRVAYAAADLVVARAGASTLGELAATATPALLVPYPFATDDHQALNARAYAAGGAARVVPDAELDARRLRAECEAALAPDARAALRAAARLLAQSDPRAAVVARVKRWLAANTAAP